MTEDEIKEYVERIRRRMAAAEAYAAENPSRALENARACLDVWKAHPEPRTPMAYMMWSQATDSARRYYREVLMRHYDRRPIDTTTPACEDG